MHLKMSVAFLLQHGKVMKFGQISNPRGNVIARVFIATIGILILDYYPD